MFLIVIASIYREKPKGGGNRPVIRKLLKERRGVNYLSAFLSPELSSFTVAISPRNDGSDRPLVISISKAS